MDPRTRANTKGFTLIELLLLVGVLALIFFVFWSSCSGSKPIDITQVDIIETEVLTTAGVSLRLEARVLGFAGRVIDVKNEPRVTLQWDANTAGIFSNQDGNTVVVDVPNVFDAVIDGITATARVDGNDKKTSPPGQIIVGPANSTLDFLSVDYTPDSPPVAVVLDAREAGGGAGCTVTDLSLWVVHTAFLGRDFEDAVTCEPELATYSTGRERVFQDKGYQFPWKTGSEIRVAKAEPVYGWDTNPADVPNSFRKTFVVVGTKDAGTELMAKEQLRSADALMTSGKVGVGLRLEPTNGTLVHGIASVDPGVACETSYVDGLLTPHGRSVTTDQLLFVLFVDEIYEFATNSYAMGLACTPASGQVGRVVYVAFNQASSTTTGHELGHVLSLRNPVFNAGHANNIGKLQRDNVMWSSTDLYTRSHRSRLSHGQLFRMNIDQNNWINANLTAPSKSCQQNSGTGTCPAMDLGEPGP